MAELTPKSLLFLKFWSAVKRPICAGVELREWIEMTEALISSKD